MLSLARVGAAVIVIVIGRPGDIIFVRQRLGWSCGRRRWERLGVGVTAVLVALKEASAKKPSHLVVVRKSWEWGAAVVVVIG